MPFDFYCSHIIICFFYRNRKDIMLKKHFRQAETLEYGIPICSLDIWVCGDIGENIFNSCHDLEG